VTGRRLFEDYFDLQLRFAARHAELTGAPLAEAVSRCTNLRRRFGFFGSEGDGGWAAFLDEVGRGPSHAGLLRVAMATYEHAPRKNDSAYGCFTCEPPDADGTLRLHFMPGARHRHTSPLADASLPERRAELRALFDDVKRLHPEVRQVRGLSWLYHLRAYRSLFPQTYIASLVSPAAPLHMNGSSVWGQVLDYRSDVRPGMADMVLARIGEVSVDAPWLAFPLQPLTAACSVDHFFALAGR
jgi:hypothetical protein